MLDRIHQSKIVSIMERRKDGRPVPFSIEFCKLSTGELKTYEGCTLSSVHSSGATVNVLTGPLEAPRKIRRCLLTRINGMKVYF